MSAQGIEHSFSFVFFSFPVVVIPKSVRKSEVSQPDFLWWSYTIRQARKYIQSKTIRCTVDNEETFAWALCRLQDDVIRLLRFDCCEPASAASFWGWAWTRGPREACFFADLSASSASWTALWSRGWRFLRRPGWLSQSGDVGNTCWVSKLSRPLCRKRSEQIAEDSDFWSWCLAVERRALILSRRCPVGMHLLLWHSRHTPLARYAPVN